MGDSLRDHARSPQPHSLLSGVTATSVGPMRDREPWWSAGCHAPVRGRGSTRDRSVILDTRMALLLSWGLPVGHGVLEPTASSFGFACASGGGSPRALGVKSCVALAHVMAWPTLAERAQRTLVLLGVRR